MPTALITGIAGQDGAYLTGVLKDRDYRVVGLLQPGAVLSAELEPHLRGVEFVRGDMRDAESLRTAIASSDPDEVYNLAGISSVAHSWQEPELTADVNGVGVLRLIKALIEHGERVGRVPRLLQASSSEIFGSPDDSPQDESTPLSPRNPYAVAKAFAHQTVAMFRESHAIYASSVILYNHESPLRPPTFVTRKVTHTVAAISLGQTDRLVMGDMSISRDWGGASDFVRAMWLALQADTARDYVVATGRAHSIRDFVTAAFEVVGIHDWERLVSSDPALIRPTESRAVVGDATRARELLGWEPTLQFEDLVRQMVQHDVDLLMGAAARTSPTGE